MNVIETRDKSTRHYDNVTCKFYRVKAVIKEGVR